MKIDDEIMQVSSMKHWAKLVARKAELGKQRTDLDKFGEKVTSKEEEVGSVSLCMLCCVSKALNRIVCDTAASGR